MYRSSAAMGIALLLHLFGIAVTAAPPTMDSCLDNGINSDGAPWCLASGGPQMVQRGKLLQHSLQLLPPLDVDKCAANGPVHGRFALVASYAGGLPDDLLPHILKMRAHSGWADIVVLTTAKDVTQLSDKQRMAFSVDNVKLRAMDGIVSLDLLREYTHSGQCKLEDLVGLHMLALEGYDAVALYSRDAEPRGDVRPILMCAANGHLLTANGGVDKPSTGIDFVAARPDQRLFRAVLSLANGIAKNAQCGQDFLEALVDKSNEQALQLALVQAGLIHAEAALASHIDPCIWNYRTGKACGANFDHSRVRVQRGMAREAALQIRSFPSLIARDPTFGFWFPVFNQAKSTLSVVQQVRREYPEAPIHLLGDGGEIDFTEICQRPKYNCLFEYVTPENSWWNPHSWFKRMREGAQKLGTDYIIYLDTKVKMMRRIEGFPLHDAGGIFDNFDPAFQQPVIDYIERKGRERDSDFRLLWAHCGLTGGSYFRSEAIIDAFDTANINKLDYAGLEAHMKEMSWRPECAMHLALSARGWVVYPWGEAAQMFQNAPDEEDFVGRSNFALMWPAFKPTAAFQHKHDSDQDDEFAVEEEDEKLITIRNGTQDVSCHGCVWYDFDGNLMPIPSQALLPQNAQDRFDWVPPL